MYKDRNKALLAKKEYREKNKEKIKELRKIKYMERDKDSYNKYWKEYRLNMGEKYREYRRKYREKNKDKINKYERIRYLNNKVNKEKDASKQ